MTSPFHEGVSSDTEAELVAATYRALCKHGHANLTISVITSEHSKSPSLIYHHYDSKDELVVTCLNVLLTRIETAFNEHIRTHDGGDAGNRVERALDWLFRERSAEERQRTGVLLQLRTQARHDDRLHDRITDSEQVFHEYLATSIQQDIEADVLQTADPDATAAFILMTTIGCLVQQATTNEEIPTTPVRTELERYLDTVPQP